MTAQRRKWTPALEDEIRRRTYSGQASIAFDAEGNVEIAAEQGFRQLPKPTSLKKVKIEPLIFDCNDAQYTIEDALKEIQ